MHISNPCEYFLKRFVLLDRAVAGVYEVVPEGPV